MQAEVSPVAVRAMLHGLKLRARALKRDVHAISLASRHPRVPWHAKVLALAVAGYALSPIDLIPDFIPVFGYLDDLILVPLGVWLVLLLTPDDVMAEARAQADAAERRPRSRTAAIIIITIWILAAVALGWVGFAFWTRRN
jgi:uncharacterized membrane protein YkvA (DUF1232 family)